MGEMLTESRTVLVLAQKLHSVTARKGGQALENRYGDLAERERLALNATHEHGHQDRLRPKYRRLE